jgi:predicted neuraminidase
MLLEPEGADCRHRAPGLTGSPTLRKYARTCAFAALLGVIFLPPLQKFILTPHPDFTVSRPSAEALESRGVETPFFRESFVADPSPTPSVHAASATALPNGELLSVWYGGTREGAKDVAIYKARFDQRARTWSTPEMITDPKQVQNELGRYIRKIGNPTVFSDSSGKVWLFFVTVSLGGWSTSMINYKTSEDGGQSWSEARRLVSSPFLNISTLVRGEPFEWADGTIGLPVYHELVGKFGELIRLDPEGRVVEKIRLSSGRHSLQPVIVSLDEENGLGFLRNCGHSSGAILAQRTTDAGDQWTPLEPINLPNPNAAVAALRLRDRSILLAYNHASNNRRNLWLALSRDAGQSWRPIHALEEMDLPDAEFSYPSMVESSDGAVHMLYTWNRTHIKHVTFNESWVKGL